MELWQMVLAIIGSILVPLIGYMFLMRGFIKDTAKATVGDLATEVAGLKGELKAYRETQKELIEVYKMMAKPHNPHQDKEALLEKLRNDTITRNEAIRLQQIMTTERNQAQDESDFLKVIIIVGILALIAAAINRTSQ